MNPDEIFGQAAKAQMKLNKHAVSSELSVHNTKSMEGSTVAQWLSTWLKTEGRRVRVSLTPLCCVLEQDTFNLT